MLVTNHSMNRWQDKDLVEISMHLIIPEGYSMLSVAPRLNAVYQGVLFIVIYIAVRCDTRPVYDRNGPHTTEGARTPKIRTIAESTADNS